MEVIEFHLHITKMHTCTCINALKLIKTFNTQHPRVIQDSTYIQQVEDCLQYSIVRCGLVVLSETMEYEMYRTQPTIVVTISTYTVSHVWKREKMREIKSHSEDVDDVTITFQ